MLGDLLLNAVVVVYLFLCFLTYYILMLVFIFILFVSCLLLLMLLLLLINRTIDLNSTMGYALLVHNNKTKVDSDYQRLVILQQDMLEVD